MKLRTTLAGVAGGSAMVAAMVSTFRAIGFGWNGKGILLDRTLQSPKLIAVWTTLEPLPRITTRPLETCLLLASFGIVHSVVYRSVAEGWPQGVIARAMRFAALLFVLTFLFWEFFTPFNQFGEPLSLIAIELMFWAVVAAAEAFAIAAIMEWRSGHVRP